MTRTNDTSQPDWGPLIQANADEGSSTADALYDLTNSVNRLREQLATLQDSHIAVSRAQSLQIADLTQRVAGFETGSVPASVLHTSPRSA